MFTLPDLPMHPAEDAVGVAKRRLLTLVGELALPSPADAVHALLDAAMALADDAGMDLAVRVGPADEAEGACLRCKGTKRVGGPLPGAPGWFTNQIPCPDCA